jgi:hypothetical protein
VLDTDLAKIYGIETGQFNRAIKRNASRFPKDFAFQLTQALAQNCSLTWPPPLEYLPGACEAANLSGGGQGSKSFVPTLRWEAPSLRAGLGKPGA